MPNITISRPFEYDDLETLHIRIPHKVMSHLVSDTGFWGEGQDYPPRLDIDIEQQDIDPALFLITLIDTECPDSGHWCIPERVEKKSGSIKAWDYFFRSHKFPKVGMIPKFSGILQSPINQSEEWGNIWFTIQPFVEQHHQMTLTQNIRLPEVVEGIIRKSSKKDRKFVLEDGFSRTIVWHRFESHDAKDPVELKLHHKSDATWKVEIAGNTYERIDVAFLGQLLRALGYRRTTYQVVKCNMETTPDIHPFGVE